MGRLNGCRNYLSGCMDRVKDGGVGWRTMLTPYLKDMGIVVLDPCDKPTKEGKEDSNFVKERNELKNKKDYDGMTTIMKKIRNVDLRMVDISDFLIVNIDLDTHPCGTIEEISLANRQKKPVIIRCEQGKENVPFWLYGMLPHKLFFNTWNQVLEYLSDINDETKPYDDVDGRWVFWNF